MMVTVDKCCWSRKIDPGLNGLKKSENSGWPQSSSSSSSRRRRCFNDGYCR